MSIDLLELAIAGRLVTRRHRRAYVGHRRPNAAPPAPADHLLSPAAYQLVSRTAEPVHADVDQPTGFLAPRPVSPTGQFSTVTAGGTA